ncbi:hypothetical protein [Bacillus sp. Cs-700]|uniref:hypothetical protein n=1 Tax=Bacillus sp. Cs-700 TaxID=2589818 RepID=UPI00140B53B9|nr:hypothetical protein [Bacillus sp. Cs-700]
MKDFNSLTYKELTIRYAVLTILLSLTIFVVPYYLPIWTYLVCMVIAISSVGRTLVKWLRGEVRKTSLKGDVIRSCTVSFMAILLLVTPLPYSIVVKLGIVLFLLIVNMFEIMELKNKHQRS